MSKDVSKFDYLRRRPFLVIERYRHATKGERQRSKGPDLSTTDYPFIVHRVNDRVIRSATVIIDIQQDCVVKNRLKTDATMFDDEVLKHYKEKCADMIQSAHRGVLS
jgi:hypothetical protein